MSVVLDVLPQWRQPLGAITHVDGTARVQTVSREDNERYWQLLRAFGAKTGIPMLLNTSLNNHREPIVISVREAIVCFLTTEFDRLVVGDYIVERRPDFADKLLDLYVEREHSVDVLRRPDGMAIGRRHDYNWRDASVSYVVVSEQTGRLLYSMGRGETLRELSSRLSVTLDDELVQEFMNLWSERLIRLSPDGLWPAVVQSFTANT